MARGKEKGKRKKEKGRRQPVSASALRLFLIAFSLFAGLVTPGCQFFLDRRQATPPPLPLAAHPPVRAEEITPDNAAEKIRELNDELDRDIEGDSGK
jgi:hypothetical protein